MKQTPPPIREQARDDAKSPHWTPKPPSKDEVPFTRIIEPITIAQGLVLRIGSVGRPVTLVRHRKAFLWVNWYADALPPGVKVGKRIAFIGKLRTFDLGRRFQIVDSLLLGVGSKTIVETLYKILPKMTLNPFDYLSEHDLENLGLPKEEMPERISKRSDEPDVPQVQKPRRGVGARLVFDR